MLALLAVTLRMNVETDAVLILEVLFDKYHNASFPSIFSSSNLYYCHVIKQIHKLQGILPEIVFTKLKL